MHRRSAGFRFIILGCLGFTVGVACSPSRGPSSPSLEYGVRARCDDALWVFGRNALILVHVSDGCMRQGMGDKHSLLLLANLLPTIYNLNYVSCARPAQQLHPPPPQGRAASAPRGRY